MRPFGKAKSRILVVRGAEHISKLRPILLELRDRVGQSDDMLTSPDWFMSRTLMWDATPVVVLQSVDEVIQSAVLLHVRCWHGIWTGVLKCGDLTGAAGVIALTHNRLSAVERAVETIFDNTLAHTVVATLRQPAVAALSNGCVPPTHGGGWQTREVRCRLNLIGGLDEFLLRQSRKFRRNFHYYRRCAEVELGCRFLPNLTAAQSSEAVRALHGQGIYVVPGRRAIRHEAAVRNTAGSFAMGLIDKEGRWISYLAGWRQAESTFIEWQLNVVDHEATSLSTVMRSFLVDHEAKRGAQSLMFVGGTSGSWARACELETCADLLAIRKGPISHKLIALLAWLHPNGQVGQLYREQSAKRLKTP